MCVKADTTNEMLFATNNKKMSKYSYLMSTESLKLASRDASCALAGRTWIRLSFTIDAAIVQPFGKPPLLSIFILGHNAVFPEDEVSKLKTSTINSKRASLRFVCCRHVIAKSFTSG